MRCECVWCVCEEGMREGYDGMSIVPSRRHQTRVDQYHRLFPQRCMKTQCLHVFQEVGMFARDHVVRVENHKNGPFLCDVNVTDGRYSNLLGEAVPVDGLLAVGCRSGTDGVDEFRPYLPTFVDVCGFVDEHMNSTELFVQEIDGGEQQPLEHESVPPTGDPQTNIDSDP